MNDPTIISVAVAVSFFVGSITGMIIAGMLSRRAKP